MIIGVKRKRDCQRSLFFMVNFADERAVAKGKIARKKKCFILSYCFVFVDYLAEFMYTNKTDVN
jgi:hypothetical protein